MTNRWIAVVGVVVVAAVAFGLVHSVRSINREDRPKASQESAEPQKEARKAPAVKHKGGHDDSWTPIASTPSRKKGAADENAAEAAGGNAAAGTAAANGAPGGPSFGEAPGMKGDKNKSADAAKNATAAGAAGGQKAPESTVSPEAAARSEQLAKIAQDLVNKGNLDEARNKLNQSLRENPKNSGAWRQLAGVEKQAGNVEAELAAYDQWTSAMPEDKMAHYEAATAYARNGMQDQALQQLSSFQMLSSGDPQSNGMASIIYGQMNMATEQGTALSQYVNAQPTNIDAHRMLGEYYQRTGQTDAAFQEYQTMAQLDPKSTAPYMQMGNAYVQMGQFDSALTQFESAAKINPRDTEALSRMAYMQRQLGDMQGAVQTYQRVVSIDPNSTMGVQAAQHMQYIQGEIAGAAQPK